ncbi:ClpX C4-type zinc finger protein [Nocardioides mangrovi]|uniref:ClpX C4-type zinc finger protein n=1 Tax=Nocardioides mangrovi TaxID=2874580 RepID=A0ABS7UAW6_9ACTN|nr:ClpX C4-type zinc finger protein [Nocardioides mangrovi]MBZ5738145.1 ClpX C4-type zinc finger protein [Nocardioides mangrovi]
MDTDVERKHCSFCGVRGKRGMLFAGGHGAMICESCVAHYADVFSSSAKTAKASVPPWESMSDAEILSNLPLIARTAEQVDDFLVEWVELARSRQLSWAAIGTAMGVSRQAAWERFARRVEQLRERSTTA